MAVASSGTTETVVCDGFRLKIQIIAPNQLYFGTENGYHKKKNYVRKLVLHLFFEEKAYNAKNINKCI